MADETRVEPKYDLSEVYTQAFSHLRLPYPNLVAESKTLGLSPFGTIRALRGSFKLQSTFNTEYALPIKLDGWQFPQEPIVSIRGGKNIIETQLNRLDPKTKRIQRKNVLEEINLNNYKVLIRGILLNEDEVDSYPEQAVRRLREIVEKPGSISIENGLTALWGITKVAVSDWDMREVQGYIGAQSFELECLSDEDFDLEINDNPERI